MTVATCPEVVSAPAQCENPLGRVTVAPEAGIVKPAGKVTLIVPPEASAPVDDVVKPSVHVAVEFAVCGAPAKLTPETEVAAAETAMT